MTTTYLSPGVYVKEREPGSRPIEGVGTAIAAFVGVAAAGPFHQPVYIANWGQFVTAFGGFAPGTYLPMSVYQFFNNGGGGCYVVRVGADSNGSQSKAVAELTSTTKAGLGTYRVEALEPGSAGDDLAIEIREDASAAATESVDGDESFTIIVKKAGAEVERHENLQTRKGKQNVATLVNEVSQLVRIAEIGSASVPERRPVAGELVLHGGATATPQGLTTSEFVGDPAKRTGIGALESLEDVTMVAVPDLMLALDHGLIDLDGVQGVQQALIDHCTNMKNRVAILDAPPRMGAQEVRDWRVNQVRYDAANATLYWPWVEVDDPISNGRMTIPPSGAVAGIWGRSDDSRGVHKAPANEVVRGALDLEMNITRSEHDLLNPVGINVIRSFPGRGIRVWGARTLSSDTNWKYVNVRRLFNYLNASINNGTQWAVFEPNDMDLWQRLRRTISSFLLSMWRDGALFGATPDEAFYVKCDAETNPIEDIKNGIVKVEVGVAPVRPAEFVVFIVSQYDPERS